MQFFTSMDILFFKSVKFLISMGMISVSVCGCAYAYVRNNIAQHHGNPSVNRDY